MAQQHLPEEALRFWEKLFLRSSNETDRACRLRDSLSGTLNRFPLAFL